MATSKETTVQATEVATMQHIDPETINALVAQMVSEQLAIREAEKATVKVVDASIRDKQAVEPAKYLAHYRNDLSPDIQIQMRSINDDGSAGSALRGRYIKFRRGHFFATKEDEVAFIEWLMRTPAFDPTDASRPMGGNPSIYVSDGKDIVACLYCNERFVAGSNAMKSHMRATHGIT
jgi:hypothetical protein